jgi:hypothetical protein
MAEISAAEYMFQLCLSLSQNICSASHTSLAYSTCTILSGARLYAFEKHSKHKMIIALMKNTAVFFKELSLTDILSLFYQIQSFFFLLTNALFIKT